MTFETCLDHETIERIVSSPAVQDLHGRPRYDVFMHEQTTHEQWIEVLDCDFDNRTHLFKTAVLCQAIAITEDASEETTWRAVLTGLLHDAAESVTGDKNIHLKGKYDDNDEVNVLNDLVDTGRLHVTRDELLVVQATMLDKQNGAETEEGVIFDLSEVGGYQISAVTAWQTQKEKNGMSEEQRRLLRLLAVNVTAGQLALLFAYHDKDLKTPSAFFDGIGVAIEEIFNYGSDTSVLDEHARLCHEKGFGHKAEALEEGFHIARSRWEAYTSQTNTDRLVA